MDTSRSSEHAPCFPSHPERWRNILHPDAAHDLHNSHRAIIAHVPATPDGRVTSNITLKQKEAIISVNGSSSGGERTYFSIYDPDGTRPHPRPKRYGCPQCTKMFDRPSARDLHILVHTGEKPHECSLCERRFSTVSNRNRHMRNCNGMCDPPPSNDPNLFTTKVPHNYMVDELSNEISSPETSSAATTPSVTASESPTQYSPDHLPRHHQHPYHTPPTTMTTNANTENTSTFHHDVSQSFSPFGSAEEMVAVAEKARPVYIGGIINNSRAGRHGPHDLSQLVYPCPLSRDEVILEPNSGLGYVHPLTTPVHAAAVAAATAATAAVAGQPLAVHQSHQPPVTYSNKLVNQPVHLVSIGSIPVSSIHPLTNLSPSTSVSTSSSSSPPLSTHNLDRPATPPQSVSDHSYSPYASYIASYHSAQSLQSQSSQVVVPGNANNSFLAPSATTPYHHHHHLISTSHPDLPGYNVDNNSNTREIASKNNHQHYHHGQQQQQHTTYARSLTHAPELPILTRHRSTESYPIVQLTPEAVQFLASTELPLSVALSYVSGQQHAHHVSEKFHRSSAGSGFRAY